MKTRLNYRLLAGAKVRSLYIEDTAPPCTLEIGTQARLGVKETKSYSRTRLPMAALLSQC